jgi:hypothetical protein
LDALSRRMLGELPLNGNVRHKKSLGLPSG